MAQDVQAFNMKDISSIPCEQYQKAENGSYLMIESYDLRTNLLK